MREKLIFVAVALLIIGSGTAWFLLNYERVDVDERGPVSALVRSNSNYGFSQFLDRYNIENQQLSTLNTRNQLPDTNDTLIIDFDAVYLDDYENRRIADWVAAGGHLVLPLPYYTEGSILAYFNIHSGEDDEDDEEETETEEIVEDETVDEDYVYDEDKRYVYNAKLGGADMGQFSLTYEVYDDLYSHRETLWTLQIERKEDNEELDTRTYALGFQYGLGSVSLLSDFAHWNNDNFYHDDNAHLSLAAMSQARHPGKIWFVQTIRRASLWQIIWQNAAHLLMWLALAILLFFWWAGQRIGRVQPNPTLERREFNEHLIASGRFLWSNKRRAKLLSGAQDALLSRARRRYPRLHTLSGSQAELHLRDILEEHYPTWVFAMDTPQTQTKPHFLDQIKAIQTLWKLL